MKTSNLPSYLHICLVATVLVLAQACESPDDPPIVDNGDLTQEAMVGEIPILQDSFVITVFDLDADKDPVDISTVELAI